MLAKDLLPFFLEITTAVVFGLAQDVFDRWLHSGGADTESAVTLLP